MKTIYTKENKKIALEIIFNTKKILFDSNIRLKKIENSIIDIEKYIKNNKNA